MEKIIKLQAARHTTQMVFLVVAVLGIVPFIGMTGFIYPFFFCYSCPFAWASCPIGILEHSFIDLRLYGIWDGLMLFLYVAGIISVFGFIFGRFICGWACPIGALQDLVKFVRFQLVKVKTPRMWHGRWVKYGVLFMIPVTSFVFKELVFTNFCPVGGITGTFPTMMLDFANWVPGQYFIPKVISVFLFFVLIAVVGRGWCRFLCPLGAWLSPYNKATPLNIHVDKEACVNCGLCTKNCPMNIDVPESKRSLECIGCTRCLHSCSKSAISLNIFKKKVV